MKLKLILSLLVMFMAFGSSYASFPVKRTVTNTEITTNADLENETLVSPAATSAASKDMPVALLLWFFLGGLAAHRWYLGTPFLWNILFIITLGGLGVWWIIDGINIITGNFPGL